MYVSHLIIFAHWLVWLPRMSEANTVGVEWRAEQTVKSLWMRQTTPRFGQRQEQIVEISKSKDSRRQNQSSKLCPANIWEECKSLEFVFFSPQDSRGLPRDIWPHIDLSTGLKWPQTGNLDPYKPHLSDEIWKKPECRSRHCIYTFPSFRLKFWEDPVASR